MRAFEFITEGNDREFHTGGSLGLPFPGTYEQEYDMFKSKGPQRITAMTNEALDSSYPYEGKAISGRYTFETEAGVFYKVYFQGKDLVEVAFSAILPGEEEKFRPDKTTLTGTGNSRKVFGTVVKIIKDFLEQQEPNALYFTATGSEPSRLRLYDTMLSQVDKELPNYYADRTLDLGDGKAYMLKRKQSEPVTESTETTTLDQIYHGMRPDDNEQIWNYGTMIWDQPLEIQKISARELDWQLCHQYDVEHIDDLFDRMDPEQHDIVNRYINDPNLSNYIIVVDDGHIVDGNHRSIAAALTGKSLRYVDIGEENDL